MRENLKRKNEITVKRSSAILVMAALLQLAATSAVKAQEGTTYRRIASLAPSNTELLCAAGGAKQLVGRSNFCDYPPSVDKVEGVGTFIAPNFERLTRIGPDLILLVSGQEKIENQLQKKHFQTCLLSNASLQDIGCNLRKLGEISGHKDQGEKAAQQFEIQMHRFSALIAASKSRPKVFYCVWTQPIMTAGGKSFLNEIITTCGGTNIASDIAAAYPTFSQERLLAADPDVIILPHEALGQSCLKAPPWKCLRAVRQGKVYYLPDRRNDTLSRPTNRVLIGMHWLGGILHPDLRAQLDSSKRDSK